jgi:small subunit ribosomal protein S4
MREKGKKIISSSKEEQQALISRLNKVGMNVNSIADILGLEKKDYLNRRLKTIVARKKIAKTVKEARQMIVHKKILVDGKAINAPSYLVPVEFENKISLKEKKSKIIEGEK